MRKLQLILIGLFLCAFAQAQDIKVESVEKPFSIKENNGSENLNRETSAVASIDPEGKFLLVADDESQVLLVVDAKTGQIQKTILDLPVSKKGKWEGLARDEDKNYYVVGSHSVKKGDLDADKLKNRSRLFRFNLEMTGADISTLKITNVVEWNISGSLKSEGYSPQPENNKVKVEGLAVRTIFTAKKVAKRELIVGLREPVSPVIVLAADITSPPADGAELNLKRLFTFDPGSVSLPTSDPNKTIELRLSSIEYVGGWNGFLILTSTEDAANKFHGNVMWFLPDTNIQSSSVMPQKIMTFSSDHKAEGICLYEEKTSSAKELRFAVVYDNDGDKSPAKFSFLQFVNLSR